MASSSYNPPLSFSTSKSQMYFFKIIHIISSIPPSNNNPLPDLNLIFSSITQHSHSSTKTTNNNNNNNTDQQEHEHEQEQEQQEQAKTVDDVATGLENEQEHEQEEKNVDDVATELENENDIKTKTSSFPRGDCSNCFDLLVEAARVVSESEKNNESDSAEEKETGTELITRSNRVREENEREPVVRSKRGRIQLLPCRFRDSVVEPIKRTGRNQRLSFTTNAKKRLLR